MEPSHLTPKDVASLRRQTMLGWATFGIVGPGSVSILRWVRGHRVVGIEKARRLYREAVESGRPVLVCANHLTMVDSVFLHHGLASLGDYLKDFRRFSWNVPAAENFNAHLGLRLLLYLGKTIPVYRDGDEEHRKAVLEKIKYVVSRGEVCTLFPEGRRSRTGRLDTENLTYGIGQVLRDLERPLVVCAYLRGEHQDTLSNIPRRGDTMTLDVELFEPVTKESGLRAARDLSRQVMGKLEQMEDAYFARRGSNGQPA